MTQSFGPGSIGRFVGKGLLAAIAVVAVLGCLFALWVTALKAAYLGGGNPQFSMAYASAADKNGAGALGAGPDLGSSVPVDLVYEQVVAVPQAASITPGVQEAIRLEQWSAYLSGGVTAATFLVIALLCWRLMRAKGFALWSTLALGVVSVLMGVVAVVAPWLEKRAGVRVIEALGLPTGPDHPASNGVGWVVPRPWDLQDTRWTMLALAVVLCLITVLLLKARRLEVDTDGLI